MIKTREILDSNELEKVVESIDFTPLENKLSKLVGKKIKLDKQIRVSGNSYYIHIFCDENLKEFSGLFKESFEKVLIQDFGVHYIQDVEYDDEEFEKFYKLKDFEKLANMDKKVVKEYLTISIDARYYLKSGGENGVHLVSCIYDINTNNWEF